MKKIIWASMALLMLASCGGPKIDSPEDALSQNQTSIIENFEDLYKLTPDQAKSIGSITFDVESEDGNANGSINYDFESNQKTYESAGNLDMNINVNEKNSAYGWIWNFWANINIDLITLKDKFLFKLNALNVTWTQENSQIDVMSWMADSFKEKWYFIEDTMQAETNMSKEDFLLKQKEIVSIVKKHTILEYVSTNENADYYDYDVKINEESIISIIKEFNALTADQENSIELSEEETINIRESIQEINEEMKSNIKIDKTNLNYFILTFWNEDWTLTIENNSENINLTHVNDIDWLISTMKWVKSKGSFQADINVDEDDENVLNGKISLTTDGKKSEIKISATSINQYTDEEVKMIMTISDNTNEAEVIITEPTDSINFEEAVAEAMWMMMWNH